MRHRDSKYIVIRQGMFDYGRETMFVFERTNVHKLVALMLTEGDLSRVISAGFCSIDKDGYHCFGESESLRISSRPREDSEILEDMFGEDEW